MGRSPIAKAAYGSSPLVISRAFVDGQPSGGLTRDLEAAQITAVDAFEHATVGWFDRAAKDYRRIPVDEQGELLSLIGDVARRGPRARW